MPPKTPPDSREAGGLNALKNNPTVSGCENPRRPYMKAADHGKKTVHYIRPPCKLWSCEACALQRKQAWVFIANYGGNHLLSEGLELSFVTLTSHEAVRSLVGGIAVWRDAWKKLSARWRRRSPGSQYFYVGEHKRTYHFHVHLVTSANIKTRWYKDNARSCGLGYQAKAVPITETLECGAYMGKYLSKSISYAGWPKYWRRVNTSRMWPKPLTPESELKWGVLGSGWKKVLFSMDAYRSKGYEIVTTLTPPIHPAW